MRTTLILNDALIFEAKRRAAERNASVSAIVNDALLMAFREPSGPHLDQAFKIPTFAPDHATKLDLSPEELDTLMVAEEMAQYRR
jgi:hypothetical protein